MLLNLATGSKKFIAFSMICVFVFFNSSAGLNAQTKLHLNNNPRFGFKLGLNVSDIIVDGEALSKRRYTFTGGLSVGIPLGSIVSIQPELFYSQKGIKTSSKTDVGSGYERNVASTRLNYFEVPILLNIKLPQISKNLLPSFYFGPSIGILENAEQYAYYIKVDDEGETLSKFEDSVDMSDSANSVDTGIVIGFGFSSPDNNLTSDIRYTLGLNDPFDIEDNDTKVRNAMLSIMGGYQF